MNTNVSVESSPTQGQGVFALRDFQPGEFVLAIDDTHIVVDESKLTKEQHEYDLDYLDDKVVIMQEPEKFINHSCDPSVYVKTQKGIRNVYAMHAIQKGEEITYDYSVNGDNEGSFPCNCGSKMCRKVYQGNFFKLPLEIQKSYIPYLDDWFVEKYRDILESLQ